MFKWKWNWNIELIQGTQVYSASKGDVYECMPHSHHRVRCKSGRQHFLVPNSAFRPIPVLTTPIVIDIYAMTVVTFCAFLGWYTKTETTPPVTLNSTRVVRHHTTPPHVVCGVKIQALNLDWHTTLCIEAYNIGRTHKLVEMWCLTIRLDFRVGYISIRIAVFD